MQSMQTEAKTFFICLFAQMSLVLERSDVGEQVALQAAGSSYSVFVVT